MQNGNLDRMSLSKFRTGLSLPDVRLTHSLPCRADPDEGIREGSNP